MILRLFLGSTVLGLRFLQSKDTIEDFSRKKRSPWSHQRRKSGKKSITEELIRQGNGEECMTVQWTWQRRNSDFSTGSEINLNVNMEKRIRFGLRSLNIQKLNHFQTGPIYFSSLQIIHFTTHE